jgi:transposase InsO family protein
MDPSTPAAPPPMPKTPPLAPKDHAEAVAIFRSEIVGALTRKELDHGELRAAFRALSQERFRPPGIETTRRYSVTTLERWFYAYRAGGLAALRPAPRSDRGHAQELSAEQRQLVIDIRKEHRSASVPLILRTLVADGRLAADVVSQATVRRLYVEHGLDRVPMREGGGQKTRLRWEAASPGALWHADVCHGPALTIDGKSRPLRIHALLDDASRFVVAIEARHTERETDMLEILVRALRRHGPPDVLYVDSVPRHRIDVLCPAVICGRKPAIAPRTGSSPCWRSHNAAQSESSHSRRVRSLRQGGRRGRSVPGGGWQARSAASFVRRVISA